MADKLFSDETYIQGYADFERGGVETYPYSDSTMRFLNTSLIRTAAHLLLEPYATQYADDPVAFERRGKREARSDPDPTTELGKAAQEQTKIMVDELTEVREGWTVRVGKAITDYLNEKVFGYSEDAIGNTFQRWIDLEILDEDTANTLKGMINDNETLGPLIFAGISLMLGKTWLSTTMDSIGGDYAKRIRAKWSPASPSPGEVLRAAFIDPDHTTAVRKIMRENGLSEADIDILFLANYALYDPSTVRTLYFRGVLTDAQVFERLREMGFTDTRIKEMRQTWDVIPPIQDIITMYAKEAFEPAIIQKIGLGAEFPTEGVEWAKKLGLSEEWLKKYWYAHWDQPSIQMGFEMLHRNVIDKETLDMLFRIVEIPPFWRDKLTAIAYNPYTRVDVRRMHLAGVISDEELLQAYKDLGYDDEKAGKMVDWTIIYNQGVEKDLTRGQIETAYKKRAITPLDAKNMIIELGYSDSEATFIIDMIDYTEDQNHEDDLIKNIETAYQLRLVNRTDTVNNLNRLGLPAKRIDYLMEKWDLALVASKKMPSKADLGKFYTIDLIDKAEYKEEMRGIGYSEKYITLYTKLINTIKAQGDADLLSELELTVSPTTKIPSKTDLDKFLRNGIIDSGEYKKRMLSLGYDDTTIALYMTYIQKAKGEL